jgi:hypothetical protein
MKDLIIGCSTNYDWPKLKYWVNSINKSGFKGDKVLILMNCDADTVKQIVDSGFTVVAFNQDQKGNLTYSSSLPVHVERFLHIYNFLKDKEYRYVITTDVKDVIFQQDPTKFLEQQLGERQHLMFASESIKYKDEPWGNENLLQTFGPFFHNIFKENEIFNVGVLAGRGFAMRDLCAMIFAMSVNRPIPIVDQATFNFMIAQEPYKTTCRYMRSETGWAAQLGTTADPSKIDQFRPLLLEAEPTMQDGKVCTSEGKEFTIVHQYDRVPYWKNVIGVKYG